MFEKIQGIVTEGWESLRGRLPTLLFSGGVICVLFGWLLPATLFQALMFFSGVVLLVLWVAYGLCPLGRCLVTLEPSRWRLWLEHYFAGLIRTSLVVPAIATAVTLGMSISRGPSHSNMALCWGIATALSFWLICAVIAQHFTAQSTANPAVYRNILTRYEILQAQTQQVMEQLGGKPDKPDPLVYALAELQKYQYLLEKMLEDKEPEEPFRAQDWIGASGYIRMLDLLHRAEETLFLVAPLETVLANAGNDQLRLAGSNIDNRYALLECLQRNMTLLKQLNPKASDTPYPLEEKEFAIREMLRFVRRAINEFRDERRFSLVQARNRLYKTVLLTEYLCWALTALAVVAGAEKSGLIAATAFFLVGAVVGLFNQLHLDATTETATEDYGLSTVRLLHTPLLSGLAGLGGALIIAMSTSAMVMNGAGSPPSLKNIFDLTQAPFGLLLAAMFGLTPTLLIRRLHQESEQYKADLRGSESLTRGSFSTPPPS